jgi:hypothetical protein
MAHYDSNGHPVTPLPDGSAGRVCVACLALKPLADFPASGGGHRSRCRACGRGGPCAVCADLPHRRRKVGRVGCKGCGEQYEAEPPITVAEQHAQPRGESRVYPAAYGWRAGR